MRKVRYPGPTGLAPTGFAALIFVRFDDQLSPNLLQRDGKQRVDLLQFSASRAGRDVAP